MAVSSNALTLAQYSLLSNDPIVRAVTYSLIENGAVMQDIPFVDRKTLIANGTRFEGNLPTVNWSNINEEGTTTSGTPTPFQEQAFILRNYIDVDKFLVEDENQITDPRAAQVGAYLKAQAYDFNDKFINNGHVSGNPKAITGLRVRIDNGSSYGVRSENKINGGAVDLSSSGMTAATFNAFLELFDQLLWSVDAPDGQGVVVWMNDLMKRRLERGMRQFAGTGGFSQASDQFGRTVTMYKGATIRDIGFKADQSTRIITATETNAGVDGASVHTSLYAAKLDTEHLFGWQFEALRAKDLGLMENGAIYRTLIDWAGGLYNAHTRSMARLYGVKLS